jgi:hypothetical protein
MITIVRVHQHDGHGNGRAQTETQLKTFRATVHVTRVEEWFVEAESAEEARELLTTGEGHRSHVGECLNLDIERVEGSRLRGRSGRATLRSKTQFMH